MPKEGKHLPPRHRVLTQHRSMGPDIPSFYPQICLSTQNFNAHHSPLGAFATFGVSTDTWEAGDLKFSVLSPMKQAPEPAKAKVVELKSAYVPAVYAELPPDNTRG